MGWTLSRFRAGDLVEVRSREEILATLDERGRLEELPFMPEMLQFCGRRFRVGALAHKTCDTARQTWQLRRLNAAVHLDGLRCDGAAHDGCEAECLLFWKDAWLKPASGNSVDRAPAVVRRGGCTEQTLRDHTRTTVEGEAAPRYSCQATNLYEATQPVAWWDLRHYVFDVVAGNRSLGQVLRVTYLASLRWLVARLPTAYRLRMAFNDWMHTRLTGRPAPAFRSRLEPGTPTPTAALNLQPGELVRIKSQPEIEATVNGQAKNRGLSFDSQEMAPYCGRIVKVRRRVTKIIEEPTGKMLEMKQPCITLEGVVCSGDYAQCRLNCPREIPSYWREVWLERAAADVSAPAAARGRTTPVRRAQPAAMAGTSA